jgi:hypothetical protein
MEPSRRGVSKENAFNVSVMRFSRFALFVKEKERVERSRRDLGGNWSGLCSMA